MRFGRAVEIGNRQRGRRPLGRRNTNLHNTAGADDLGEGGFLAVARPLDRLIQSLRDEIIQIRRPGDLFRGDPNLLDLGRDIAAFLDSLVEAIRAEDLAPYCQRELSCLSRCRLLLEGREADQKSLSSPRQL